MATVSQSCPGCGGQGRKLLGEQTERRTYEEEKKLRQDLRIDPALVVTVVRSVWADCRECAGTGQRQADDMGPEQ